MASNFFDTGNAARYFIDRHIDEGKEAKTAIECGERRVTYGELFLNVNRTGNALRSQGAEKGSRILLALPHIPEFAAVFFGAIKIGAVPVPVNPALSSGEYRYMLQDSEADIIITTDDRLAAFRDCGRNMPHPPRETWVIGNGIKEKHEVNFMELLDQSSPALEPATVGGDDAAFWLYSSGSTGFPKACVHRGRDMAVCAEHFAKGVLAETENDRSFSVSKLYFAYGLGNALYFPLAFGGTSILMPEAPKSEIIFKTVERYRPTIFYSVPSSYATMLAYAQAAGIGKEVFASVRCAVSAGEALPATLFRRFKEYFGVELLDGIGSTEALQTFISNRPGEVRPGSSGTIVPGYEAKILDDDAHAVPRGSPGNLWVKNDAICSGYWNQPEKTRAAIRDGWLRTGDVYREDEGGYFWSAGRADDMFKSNGQWVSPAELEQMLLEHPAVLEAAVVGKWDSAKLLKPAAYVVLKDVTRKIPDLETELQRFIAERLPRHKRPHWIIFVPSLPKTATGKIQRYKMREDAASASE
jgi:benzoate-CoA ligase